MVSILLAIICVAFISLGLPDAILGSAWPSMYRELNVSISFAGVISMIIAGGTIVSSLFSVKLIRRFGTGVVTTASVALTALALLGFSFSSAFWQLCLWGIPYGLGAGSVDAALNNFVALHYKSRHMNWLHSFWGVGAATGPYIMGLCLSGGLKWNSGYQVIGALQVALVIALMFSLPAWKHKQSEAGTGPEVHAKYGMLEILRLPGVRPVLLAFFCYCAMEVTAGLWASSYLVLNKGISAETAAKMASLFYLGITVGRFLSGFVSGKLGDRHMVRLGIALVVAGIALILLPLGELSLFAGLTVAGFGSAPIFPGLLHETPENFGKDRSQTIMGMQMASAYTGSTLMPLLFGFLAGSAQIALYPYYLLFFTIVMFVLVERVNRVCAGACEV
jgi:fucose permease